MSSWAGSEPSLARRNISGVLTWRSELEETLNSCKAVAIFVGPGEMGSWQHREVDVALDLQSRSSHLPVIPVLLPGCEPPLGFLRQLTWVDLRTLTLDLGIGILAKAARGEAPGPDIQTHLDAVRASICPYRGLLHFREEDAPFFFGREAAIDKLIDAVHLQPFVAVVGASGSGKSSVVRSGLVPRLRSDRRTAWETVILVPTDQPLKALARALVPLLEPTMGEVDRLAEASKLAGHFQSGAISLYDIVERILEKQSGTDRVLIVIDQFEELYTLSSDEVARRRFLDELLAASSRAESKANIAVTLRGDFVGKALAYRPLSDRLQDAQINLGPMTREELEDAIRKPAEKIQLEFETGLVKRILNDVGDEPGNLPLLEFVLKELWDKRRSRILLNETYDAIGGLQGAVATKADEFLEGLSSAEQKILQRVFLRIVRPSESGLDTRRRAAFTELPPEGAELVVKLAKERLLVTNRSASGLEQTVEVAHEALISNWSTLRVWVNEDREFLLWRERLGALLTEWERAQESDETLLRGSLLIEAQKWFDRRSQDLSDQERRFISASRALRERLVREERERHEREIEAARKLAEEQKRRAELSEEREKEQKEASRRLRRRAIAAAAAAAAAIILLATSVFLWRAAEHQAGIATQAERSANKQKTEAEKEARLASDAKRHSEEERNVAEAAMTSAQISEAKAAKSARDARRKAALADFDLSTLNVNRTQPDWTEALVHLARGLRTDPENALLRQSAVLLLTTNQWYFPFTEPLRHGGLVVTASFNADGTRIVTASADHTARIWDAQSGKPISGPLQHEDVVSAASFSPDGTRIVTASADRTARIWDALSGKPIGRPLQHGLVVLAASFSQDGTRIVPASADHTARIWDAQTGKPIGEPLRHDDVVSAASFSPDGTRIVTASADHTARIWDAQTGKPIGEPLEHHDDVRAASFSPDGTRIVTASADHTARIWDAQPGKPVGQPLRHDEAVVAASFSRDGTRIVTASKDRSARIWDAQSGKAIGQPLRHEEAVVAASFSRDGTRIVTASRDRSARIWDAQSGKPVGQPLQHDDVVWAASFSPDGTRIVTASADHTARIWDAQSGEPIGRPLRHDDVVSAANFSPDGTRIVTASKDHFVRIWDVQSGNLIGLPLRHAGEVNTASFSPDGTRIVTASRDHTARIWDAQSGNPIGQPLQHDDEVRVASYSPDGTRIVTASADHTARIWDAQSGEPIGQPLRHDGEVRTASFSPDGTQILTASTDSTARIWDVAVDLEASLPQWVPILLEALAGKRLDEEGSLVDKTQDLFEVRQQLLALNQDDFWSRLGHWFVTPGPERTIGPNSTVTVREWEENQEKAAEY